MPRPARRQGGSTKARRPRSPSPRVPKRRTTAGVQKSRKTAHRPSPPVSRTGRSGCKRRSAYPGESTSSTADNQEAQSRLQTLLAGLRTRLSSLGAGVSDGWQYVVQSPRKLMQLLGLARSQQSTQSPQRAAHKFGHSHTGLRRRSLLPKGGEDTSASRALVLYQPPGSYAGGRHLGILPGDDFGKMSIDQDVLDGTYSDRLQNHSYGDQSD